MYQYLTGKLVEKSPTSITLDVNGVGYHIHIPVSTYSSLPATTETVKILTHFVVREDAQLLYGFSTEEERQFFRLLLSISGIGPKMATTVLSGIQLPELKRAIVEGSLAVLTSISGIGKKTAERIIIELKEKISLDEKQAAAAGPSQTEMFKAAAEDAIRALVELGYRRPSAKEAVEQALKSPGGGKLSISDLIRTALKYI